MNPSEEIVKFWLQSNKSFIQSSIRLPYNKEIDILAVDENGNKSHIEVSVSVRMANYTRNAQQLAQEFYDKKWVEEKKKDFPNEALWKREYPKIDLDAFLASGTPYFDTDVLRKMLDKNSEITRKGRLTVSGEWV